MSFAALRMGARSPVTMAIALTGLGATVRPGREMIAALFLLALLQASNVAPVEPKVSDLGSNAAPSKNEDAATKVGKDRSVSALGTAPWSGKTPSVRILTRIPTASLQLPVEWWSVQTSVAVSDRKLGPTGHLRQEIRTEGDNVLFMGKIRLLEALSKVGVENPLSAASPPELPKARIPIDGRLLLIWEAESGLLQVQMANQFEADRPKPKKGDVPLWGFGQEAPAAISVTMGPGMKVIDEVQLYDPAGPPPWQEFFSVSFDPTREFINQEFSRARQKYPLGRLRILHSDDSQDFSLSSFMAWRKGQNVQSDKATLVVAVEKNRDKGLRLLFWFETESLEETK